MRAMIHQSNFNEAIIMLEYFSHMKAQYLKLFLIIVKNHAHVLSKMIHMLIAT